MNVLRVSSRLDEDEKATIDSLYDHYPDELIVELVRSPKEDYCLVRFKSGHDYYVRVVYAGGGLAYRKQTILLSDNPSWNGIMKRLTTAEVAQAVHKHVQPKRHNVRNRSRLGVSF